MLSCHEAWGDFFLPSEAGLLRGGEAGQGDSHAGKGSAAACCKKFVLTLRSAVRLLTWLLGIKLDAGAGLPSSDASPSWEEKGRRSTSRKNNNKQLRNDVEKHGNFPETRR